MERAVTVKFKWNALKCLDEGRLLKACCLIEFCIQTPLQGLYLLASLKKPSRSHSCALRTWSVREVQRRGPLSPILTGKRSHVLVTKDGDLDILK